MVSERKLLRPVSMVSDARNQPPLDLNCQIEESWLCQTQVYEACLESQRNMSKKIQELQILIHQYFNIPLPTREVKCDEPTAVLEPSNQIYNVPIPTYLGEMLANEPAVVEEISKQIDHQALDEIPELQGCHKPEVLSYLSKEKKASDCDKSYVLAEKREELKALGMQTEEKDLTCINTPLLMEFENCIVKSEYIGLKLSKKLLPPKFAFDSLYDGSSACVGNFAFGVSRIGRVVRDDFAEMLNFDPEGQQLRELNEPCLEGCSFMGLSMLKIDDVVTQGEEMMLSKRKGEANVAKETWNLVAYQVFGEMLMPQQELKQARADLETSEVIEMINSLGSPTAGIVMDEFDY